MYIANVVEVLIASPSDVSAERDTVREVIHEWNAIHARERKTILLPLAWETHTAPDLSRKPQELINEKVVHHADLVVGVFWTRIGTATDEYVSGTVEEIEEHVKSAKPAMLYFSLKSIEPDRIDPDQYAKLKEFRAACETRGLYDTYADIYAFRSKFVRQLAIMMNGVAPAHASSSSSADVQLQQPQQLLPQPPALSISSKALEILREASQSQSGQINRHDLDQTYIVQVNGKSFRADLADGRGRAELESALADLEDERLIQEVIGGSGIFQITRRGYRFVNEADLLNAV